MMMPKRQQGVVLIVSLLLLVVVTVLAVSSIRMGTVNLRIVDNMQSQQATSAIAQEAVARMLSDVDNFTSPTSQTMTIDGVNVTATAPTCVGAKPAPGNSAKQSVTAVPEDATYQFTVSIGNGVNGSTTCIEQGVRIRWPFARCPANPGSPPAC